MVGFYMYWLGIRIGFPVLSLRNYRQNKGGVYFIYTEALTSPVVTGSKKQVCTAEQRKNN